MTDKADAKKIDGKAIANQIHADVKKGVADLIASKGHVNFAHSESVLAMFDVAVLARGA